MSLLDRYRQQGVLLNSAPDMRDDLRVPSSARSLLELSRLLREAGIDEPVGMPLHDVSPGNLPPGYEFGYDQITANVTVSSTTESSGTSVIAASAHVFDGTPVMAQFSAPIIVTANVAGATVTITLWEGATEIGRLGQIEASGAVIDAPFSGWLRFTPTVGSHTYTVFAHQSGGNGTIFAGAGGVTTYVPAFLRFTKV